MKGMPLRHPISGIRAGQIKGTYVRQFFYQAIPMFMIRKCWVPLLHYTSLTVTISPLD